MIKVTPSDYLQIVYRNGTHEFVDDRSPFRVRVSEIIRNGDEIIGVSGPVIDGHARYHGLIATLLTRLENSHWKSDVRSAANFKIGSAAAHLVNGISHFQPDGSVMDSYPFIIRYGSIQSET
jgi:hypothetical protein